MNVLTDLYLQIGERLYRYDIIEPPKNWTSTFKNPEYIYPDTGVKNQVGAFFFFNSRQQAQYTAYCAINKCANLAKGIWITECTIKESVKLLDLRDSFFTIELLAALDNSGFPIFTSDFRSWWGTPFSTIKDDIHSVEEIVLKDASWIYNPEQKKRIDDASKKMYKALSITNDHIGHLLQLLTDYSNGICFKSMLQEKDYEGYIFNETNSPYPPNGTDTVCVFSSEKFLPPFSQQLCLNQ